MDFLEATGTFLRGTLLLFSLDLEEIFRLVAGDTGILVMVSLTDDVDKDCCSLKYYSSSSSGLVKHVAL